MEPTQGNKTSEFQVVIVNVSVAVAMALLGKITPEMALMVISGISGLYIIARVVVKLTPNKKDDEILDIVGQVIDKVKEKQTGIPQPK